MTHHKTLPYCTVKGFRRCIQILRAAPPAERVTRQSLLDRGFLAHAAYPVLGALRFLHLITDEGERTPALDCFLAEDDMDGRRHVVETAYADVLATVEFPVEDRETVDEILTERHGCATGVAAFCATFFLWLAADAGMPVSVVGPRRRGRPPAHLAELSEAARASLAARSDQPFDPVFAEGRRPNAPAPRSRTDDGRASSPVG